MFKVLKLASFPGLLKEWKYKKANVKQNDMLFGKNKVAS